MAWIWTVFITAIFSALAKMAMKKKEKRLPPGPKGLPILGHFHLLGKNPHQDMYHLAKQHGPIIHLRFGSATIIHVSSADAAKLFLKTHDHVFASRPRYEAAKYILYDEKDLIAAKYGPYWRQMRKLCTLQLLSPLKITSFRPAREQEVKLGVISLIQNATAREPVDLSAFVSTMNANMSCVMVFGKKYTEEEFAETGFRGVMRETTQLSAAPNLKDYFYLPLLGGFDFQGLTRRMKAVARIYDDFFERVINDHIEGKDEKQTKDIVDTLIGIMESGKFQSEFQFDRRHVKALMLDMLVGSMDTSATAIEWILSEMIRHPMVMKKVQNELEEVVGKDRMVQESDLKSLHYLEMVIKEAFRLHPVAPLLLPHEAMEDSMVSGFHIPKGSRILVNTWAIGRDPEFWPEPEKFIPERFLGSDIDVKGHDFELLPFGSGRRSCPGIQLGLVIVRLIVAQLVHCFDWELPDGMLPEDLDMTELFGTATVRANSLKAIPKYRLTNLIAS
ncbi:PREDICTED: cytochrome P450 CYP736A12-like [Ipomoea nil]|uniref:cytochrome P450 CYP736A12-like n=1 Tax=Ipomoea nil TaxID=35883 RepID=UPI000900E06B|nr:PREDICTED: cytochrome P450 CYP736A12-like [Ipomoea nil]